MLNDFFKKFFLVRGLFLIFNFNKLNTSKKWQERKKIQRQKRNKNKKQKNSHINWEESSRLKANSEVDTSGPFFVFFSLLLRFPFFFLSLPYLSFLFFPLSKRTQPKPNKTKHFLTFLKQFESFASPRINQSNGLLVEIETSMAGFFTFCC